MGSTEPSIWDYVKAKLTPWKGPAPAVPLLEKPQVEAAQEKIQEAYIEAAPAVARIKTGAWPWRSLVTVFLALIAQGLLEPRPNRNPAFGVALYVIAFAWLAWTSWTSEWQANLKDGVIQPGATAEVDKGSTILVRPLQFILSVFFSLLAYWQFGGNLFTRLNVFLWLAAIILMVWSFWQGRFTPFSWVECFRNSLKQKSWRIEITPWSLLVMGVMILVVFFRVVHLGQTPPEMVSDHAEKLLDIGNVLRGETSIFFPRNTGREAFQMYLTAAAVKIFGTGLTFLSLKISTTIAGLVTLIYIYFLGKELGNRRIGLLAVLFAGMAYWPNVITRIALRFTLYPLFVAPVFYYLIRGIRRSSLNDFILAGLALGIGLHGYSPFRAVPFIILVAVGIYLLHRSSRGNRKLVLQGLIALALISLCVFLPLLRYAIDEPQMYSYRTLTRIGDLERPLPGPVWKIFLQNSWNAIAMYSWDDGEVWPISVTHRPVLDFVSGALFHLGVILLLVRYLRRRSWLDVFLVLSVYLLMLPSIMSLAFPAENPAVNRAAGAIVPVFLIIGIALDGLLTAVKSRLSSSAGTRLTWVLAGVLVLFSAAQNYDLVFRQYQRSYELSSWNTSEMGQVIRSFTQTIGSRDSAWVVGYPYWVDTRLVGINAGYPDKDYAIRADQFKVTLDIPGAKLFLLNLQDTASLAELQALYPQSSLQEYQSHIPDKDFYILFVPPESPLP